MLEMSVDTGELAELARDLKRYQVRAKAAVRGVMRDYSRTLRAEVVRNASGRPGPRINTGAYVASIRTYRGSGAERFSLYVASNHPAAHRLEFGFVGMDSAGRYYNQPPYPHFRPALARLEPGFYRSLASAVRKAW